MSESTTANSPLGRIEHVPVPVDIHGWVDPKNTHYVPHTVTNVTIDPETGIVRFNGPAAPGQNPDYEIRVTPPPVGLEEVRSAIRSAFLHRANGDNSRARSCLQRI